MKQDYNQRMSVKYASVFNTPQGREVLDNLSRALLPASLMGETPQDTAYLVGIHDTVKYIKEMTEAGMEATNGE